MCEMSTKMRTNAAGTLATMSSMLNTDNRDTKDTRGSRGDSNTRGSRGDTKDTWGSRGDSYARELARTLQEGWAALSTDQKAIVGGLAAVDAAGKAAALVDLARRDRRRVRGPKQLWAPVIAAVNTGGWAAYFLFGRKG